jgi:hypothetical protein
MNFTHLSKLSWLAWPNSLGFPQGRKSILIKVLAILFSHLPSLRMDTSEKFQPGDSLCQRLSTRSTNREYTAVIAALYPSCLESEAVIS